VESTDEPERVIVDPSSDAETMPMVAGGQRAIGHEPAQTIGLARV